MKVFEVQAWCDGYLCSTWLYTKYEDAESHRLQRLREETIGDSTQIRQVEVLDEYFSEDTDFVSVGGKRHNLKQFIEDFEEDLETLTPRQGDVSLRLMNEGGCGAFGRGNWGEKAKSQAAAKVHSIDFSGAEHLGIPSDVWNLKSALNWGLDSDPSAADVYGRRFMEAIPVGANLATVWVRFAIRMLLDVHNGLLWNCKDAALNLGVQKVAHLYLKWKDGDKPQDKEFKEAAEAVSLAGNAATVASNIPTGGYPQGMAAHYLALQSTASLRYLAAVNPVEQDQLNSKRWQSEVLLEVLADSPVIP